MERVYYTKEQVENICFSALKSVDLLPCEPQPIRIDRFIEKKFNTSVDYQLLPDEVMGYTVFEDGQVSSVVVSKSLDADVADPARRRLRTTIAHEAGHGLLHAYLFSLKNKGNASLFMDFSEPEKPKILCRNIAPERKQYNGEWWEYQANLAISRLLMPRYLVMESLSGILEKKSKLGVKTLPENKRQLAIRLCSDVFDVNPIVAQIRIDEIWPSTTTGQLTL